MARTLDGTNGVTASGTITADTGTIYPIVLGAATSAGTSSSVILSNTIPSWVKRITVMVNGISATSAGGNFLVRLGSGGATVSTGYSGIALSVSGSVTATGVITDGIFIGASAATTTSYRGKMYIDLMDSVNNVWQGSSSGARSGDANVMHSGFGQIALSGVLNTVELVVTAGNFDAGTVSISYE
jgi:hypothetical protein